MRQTLLSQRCDCNNGLLGNNPRLARDVIISFVIFNKNTLNLFNLDIGSVLTYFLVYSVRMFDFLVFFGKNQKLLLFVYFYVINFR